VSHVVLVAVIRWAIELISECLNLEPVAEWTQAKVTRIDLTRNLRLQVPSDQEAFMSAFAAHTPDYGRKESVTIEKGGNFDSPKGVEGSISPAI
jgi:hypothetical protein